MAVGRLGWVGRAGRFSSSLSQTSYLIEYLLAGGGGGGGLGWDGGGGGGAGGEVLQGQLTLRAGEVVQLTVGSGGAGGTSTTVGVSEAGQVGTATIFGALQARPGGGGVGIRAQAGAAVTQPTGTVFSGGGGSGGFDARTANGVAGVAGGFAGGNGQGSGTEPKDQSGGGGAGAAGAGLAGSVTAGGNGGQGVQSIITGFLTGYGGGGGGGKRDSETAGLGRDGGGDGGLGPTGTAAVGQIATQNTGGGGGGGGGNSVQSTPSGGAGASGIVVVAYPATFPALTISGSLTYNEVALRAGWRVYRFTGGTGTIRLGEAPFEGLLDRLGVAAAGVYSAARRLASGYNGPLINVRRSTDNDARDIPMIYIAPAIDGWILDTTTLMNFVGGGDGFVTRIYDQSGLGRNAAQTTPASQPRIVVGGVLQTINGRPAPVYNGVAFGQALATPSRTLPTTITIFGVTSPSEVKGQRMWLGGSTGQLFKFGYTTQDFARINGQTTSSALSYVAGVPSVRSGRLNNTVLTAWRNGTQVAQLTTANPVPQTGAPWIGGAGDGQMWPGHIGDVILFDVALTDAQRELVEQDLMRFYMPGYVTFGSSSYLTLGDKRITFR